MYRSTEWLAHYRQIMDQTFTVVDVETTGSLDPKHRVIEISVLKATLDAGIQMQSTTLINPNVRVPPKIAIFTGINQNMVDQAPSADQVWPRYLTYLREGVLTGHNIEFDYTFLQLEYQRLGTLFKRSASEQLCTVALARLMLPSLPSRSLQSLVQYFGLKVGSPHRAESDTLACWLVAELLLKDLQTWSDQQILTQFEQEWISLKTVAGILNCSQKQARTQLKQADIAYRVTQRGKYLYKRQEVEQIDLGFFS